MGKGFQRKEIAISGITTREKLLTVLFLAALAAPARGADPPESLALVYDDGAGKTMPYRLFLPPGYDPAVRYPLVLFLHGAGECGADNLLQIGPNAVDLIAHTQSERFASFLVAPQAPDTDKAWYDWSTPLVDGILDEIMATYPSVDERRLYVTGLSMGGFGTLWQIYRHPEKYAAAVPISSGIPAGSAAYYAEFFWRVPIWIFHGALDDVVPAQYSRDLLQALLALGGDPRYTEYPDMYHNAWLRAYADADDELFPWLFNCILGGPEARYSPTAEGGEAPVEICFSAEDSFPGEGASLARYDWDFGDGVSGEGVAACHTYTEPGVYRPKLRVTNDGGFWNETAAGSVSVHCPRQDMTPWTAADVGSVELHGAASLEDGGRGMSICAGKGAIAGTADAFHFVHQQVSGDAALSARIDALEGSQTVARVGVMFRDGLEPGSSCATVCFTKTTTGTTVNFQLRDSPGSFLKSRGVPLTGADVPSVWLRIEKRGEEICGHASTDGNAWTEIARQTLLGFPASCLAGVAVTGTFATGEETIRPLRVELQDLSLVKQIPQGVFMNVRNADFGIGVNTSRFEYYPAVSPDDKELYFATTGNVDPARFASWRGDADIWVATRESLDEPFGDVKNLQDLAAGPEIVINSASGDYSGCISYDLREMYFSSYRDGPAGLFVAKRAGPGEPFVSVEKLGNKVNLAGINQGGPKISSDDLTLLFLRNVTLASPRVLSQSDIWIVHRESKEKLFGAEDGPDPYPFEVNSPIYDEFRPSISTDGLSIFFCDFFWVDPRPGGLGTEDIWVTFRNSLDAPFGEPVNLNVLWPGSTVNSSSSEIAPALSPDWPGYGSRLYFASNRPGTLGGSGDGDIWEATWVQPPPQAEFTVDPELGTAPLEVAVDGSASSGYPGLNIVTYEWDFGAGATAEGMQATHAYAEAGLYTIRLTVTDDRDFDFAESGSSGSATREVSVGCPLGGTGTWSFSDIGQPPLSGSPWFEGAPDTGDLHICTSGKRIGSTSDECLFLYKEIAGDFLMTARIASVDHTGSGSAAGVMVRASLDGGAITASMHLYGSLTASPRRARFGYRLKSDGGLASKTADLGAGEAPVWVRLERRDETLSAFHSLDGDAWTEAGEQQIPGLPETLLAGVAACKGTVTVASGPQALQAVMTNLALEPLLPPQPLFLRGDANADGITDISDAVTILGFLFLGDTMNDCQDAADANDDGKVDISDPVRLLGYLFLGSKAPPEPFGACGADPTEDDPAAGDLGCNLFDECP